LPLDLASRAGKPRMDYVVQPGFLLLPDGKEDAKVEVNVHARRMAGCI
jgi:hypothetical protein